MTPEIRATFIHFLSENADVYVLCSPGRRTPQAA
jgi:hypothetical protein